MAVKYRTRKNVYDRDKGICLRCGCPVYLHGNQREAKNKKKGHFHHIVFRCNNGNDKEENLLLSCWPCEKEWHRQYELKQRRKNHGTD